MLARPPASPGALFGLITGADRLVLAGHPQPMAVPGTGTSTVFRPKDLLLELLRVGLPADGPEILAGNPHFLRIAEWSTAMTVLHGPALEVSCPVPLARNLQLLDGEDLLGLAEEHREGDPLGLRRQRIGLMDGVLNPGTMPVPPALVPVPQEPLPLEALLRHRGRLPRGNAAPVEWCACDVETGPYNFLQRRLRSSLGTSHLAVLLDSVRGARRPWLIAFATAETLPELGPVLRACAALPAASGTLLNLLFFGSPEELAGSLEAWPQAGFFGDNFRSPAIRLLFGPFAAADLLNAVAGAAGSVDTCHGGVLDALARGLGVPNRIILGPDGRFDAWRGAGSAVQGVRWDAIHAPETLVRRRRKTDRSEERHLLALLAGML